MPTLSLTILTNKPTKNGKYHLMVRINAGNQKSYIKTEYTIDDASQWYNGKVVARSDASMMNKRLLYELKKYKERLSEVDNVDCYSARQLKDILTQQDRFIPETRTFNDFMRRRISEMRDEGRESYAKMMEDTLILFEKSEGDVPMIIMNHLTVSHFDRWLKMHGHTDGGRQIRLCHIKARVNEAIKLGLIRCDIHPFAYTKIPVPQPREMDISPDNVRKIINCDVSSSKRLTLAKDTFLLSFYLGGMNFADLMQIDFRENTITYKRQKVSGRNAGTTRLTIQPEARLILNKYLSPFGRIDFGYNYSEKNLQCYLNQCLKLLAKELGIRSTMAFYSARKSFAQMASEIGIPDAVIDYCLGHSDRSRGVIRYYTQIRQKHADVAIRRVIDYALNPDLYKDYIELRMQLMMGLAI